MSKNLAPSNSIIDFEPILDRRFLSFLLWSASTKLKHKARKKEKRGKEHRWGKFSIKRPLKIGPKPLKKFEGAEFFGILRKFRPWMNTLSSDFSHLWKMVENQTTFRHPTSTQFFSQKFNYLKLKYTSPFWPFWSRFRHIFIFFLGGVVAEILAFLWFYF